MEERDLIKGLLGKLNDLKGSVDEYTLDLTDSLARLLIRRMNELNMNQKELAAKSKVGPRIISDLIHSKCNPTLSTIGKILCALDYPSEFSEIKNPRVKEYSNKVGQSVRLIADSLIFDIWEENEKDNFKEIYEKKFAECYS